MDVVLPPGTNPFYRASIINITPKETSPDEVICRGKREGMECRLPKMYSRSPCANPKCSKYKESSKPREDTGSNKEKRIFKCKMIDKSGNICGETKKSARSSCPKNCRGVTKYKINKQNAIRKTKRPDAPGVLKNVDLSQYLGDLLDQKAQSKPRNKKRINTKKKKYKKRNPTKKKLF